MKVTLGTKGILRYKGGLGQNLEPSNAAVFKLFMYYVQTGASIES